ncbi:MAG TPA: hypothetical protein VJ044_01360, partial [Candidatus Hodarchaeales archaeon]|nr:hypothetical protein [Candidatus Hodarchaeales archaeon]
SLTTSDIDAFISQVDSVSQIVHEELGLKKFSREGFRVWYIFATDSEENSQEWISGLGAFSVSPNLKKAFEGTLESEGHVAVVNASDRKYRIAVNAVERLEQLDLGGEIFKVIPRNLSRGQREARLKQYQAKQRVLANPEFAVMIDVDAVVDQPIDVVPSDFIHQSLRAIEEGLPKALSGGGA